jgi:hypothetical protein
MKSHPNELKYNEPSAVRCACGQLCANPVSHLDHARFCQVVQETGIMFANLEKPEEGKEVRKLPRRRQLISGGDE